MLLLRWLFLDDPKASFYDLEDESQEQFDEDWISLQWNDDFIQVWLDEEDLKDEVDDDYVYRLEDDSTELVEEFIEVILTDEDLKDEDEDVWYDAYGNVDLPPPPDTTSEQIWYIYSQEEEEDRGDYEDDLYDPYGTVDQPIIVFFGGKQLTPEIVRLHNSSSNIDTVLYDKNTKEMQIRFKHGGTYKYEDVAPNKFKGIGKAKSAGAYFHSKIKPKHPGKKM